jgi:hypothetical protein
MCLGNKTPEIFLPTRTTKKGPQYRDLSSHVLKGVEKTWLMSQHLGIDDEGEYIVKTKQGVLNDRYNINQSFWKNNMKTYKREGACNEGAGDIYLVSQKEADKMAKLMMERRRNTEPPSRAEIFKLVAEAAKATAIARGKPLPTDWELTDTTFKSHCDHYSVSLRTAIGVTDAREKSCKCPLMSLQWFYVCMAISNGLPAHRKWNIDASSFVFKKDKGKVCVVDESKYTHIELDKEFEGVKPQKEAKSKDVSSSLPFGIKWMNLINAAGENGEFVGVIAVKEMKDDEFHYEQVNDIGLTSYIGEVGHLYFSQTRAGTAKMWQHYFKNIVCPTIKKSNEIHMQDDLDNIPEDQRHPTEPPVFKNFLSSDGEDIIAAQGYNADIIWHFSQLDIIYARIGAALTGIHQACDRNYTFKGSKKKIKTIEKNGGHIVCDRISRSVGKAFDNLKIDFPDTKVSAEYRKSMIYAVSLLVTVLRDIITPTHNKNAFQCCGQHVIKSGSTDTVDFDVMMNQCWTEVSNVQRDIMKKKIPVFVQQVLTSGMIPHAMYAEHGITGGTTTINRDDLTHIRASSHIINCDAAVAKFEADKYKQSEEYKAGIRNIKEKAKTLKKAHTLVNNKDKAVSKKAAQDAAKKAAKNLATQRAADYEGLTRTQKRKRDEEDNRNEARANMVAIEKLEKKRQKRINDDQKLREARALVAMDTDA